MYADSLYIQPHVDGAPSRFIMIQTQSVPAPAEAGAGAHPSDPSSAPSLHHRPQKPPFDVSSVGKIKYADPRSLPSYPSFGLRSGGAASDAAATASRMTSDQRPAEPSKFDEEWAASATAAAFVAKDYKMPPTWEPSFDEAGSRAAVAAFESADAALKKPDTADGGIDSGFGSTAADQAFNAVRPPSPAKESSHRAGAAAARASYIDQVRSEKAELVELPPIVFDDESLAAALGAISSSKQADGGSQDAKTLQGQPQPTDATTASASALEGATAAHRESMRAVPQEDIGATPVTTMTRAMFTAQPPVKPETDQIEENERVHQSAVAMAKKIYRNQRVTTDTEGNVLVSNPFGNLQDIAFRQAQERLASLQDDRQKAQEYKDYYAAKEDGEKQEPVPRRRLSLMTKLRRRSSDGERPEDRRRQRKTNREMPLFGHRPSRAEQEQRDRDREAVLAAAHRNVKLQLQGMDDQANRDSRRSEADSRRRSEREDRPPARAQSFPQSESDADGRIDIGGGRFMDATEIDAIAASRVGPLLADIDGSVEADRGRMASLRAEEETRRADLRRQRSRSRERKELEKRFKEEDKREAKARKLQAKQDEKARKEMAKEAKAERKRQLKEDKRRRRQIPVSGQSEALGEGGGNPGRESTADGAATDGESPRQSAQEPTRDSHQGSHRASNQGSNPGPSGGSSKGSSSPIRKVAGWFKSHLSRKKDSGKEGKSKKGFVGGAALRGSGDNEAGGNDEETPRRAERTSPQGPMSDDGTLSNSHQSLEAPQAMADTPPVSSSPARDSRFREIMDQ